MMVICSTCSLGSARAFAADTTSPLEEVLVTARRIQPLDFASAVLDADRIASKRFRTSDTAGLLANIAGVSTYTAGGVSSLPSIRGLADDRLRTKVDGMDLIASCPNHMNSPLSYIDPTAVNGVQVYAGVTPVSVGGDSIGGSIVVQSAPPLFARPGEHNVVGETGAFYRGDGDAWGGDLSVTYATESVSVGYAGSYARASDYEAGSSFKDYAFTGRAGHTLTKDTVGSTAYESSNQAVKPAHSQATANRQVASTTSEADSGRRGSISAAA